MGLAPLVRLLRPLSALLVFAAVAGGVVMGVRLAAGDPPEPFTPRLAPGDPPPSVTPRPGTPNPGPSPDDFGPAPSVAPGGDRFNQPPLRVAGIDVPVPAGAYTGITGPGLGGVVPVGGPTQGIYRGNSYVLFNEQGVTEARIQPEDEEDFRATLQVLGQLSAAEQ